MSRTLTNAPALPFVVGSIAMGAVSMQEIGGSVTLVGGVAAPYYSCSCAASYTITLPPAVNGLRYKFYLESAVAGGQQLTFTSPNGAAFRGILGTATTPFLPSGATFVRINPTAFVGDFVEFVGQNSGQWFVSGQSGNTNANAPFAIV